MTRMNDKKTTDPYKNSFIITTGLNFEEKKQKNSRNIIRLIFKNKSVPLDDIGPTKHNPLPEKMRMLLAPGF